MIWVTWRQFRGTILVGVLTPVLIAAVMAATALTVGNPRSFGTVFFYCFGYSTTQCLAESTFTLATLATLVLPVLLGVFVGVTVFSRDLERRTHVLGLTQGVSRRRWYWMRVLVVFGPVVAAMILLGLVSHWARYQQSGIFSFAGYIEPRLSFPAFGMSGFVPAAYTVVGLIIGSTCALLFRNTLASMVVTLIAMIAVLVVFPTIARERYASPEIEKVGLEEKFYGTSSALYANGGGALEQPWVIGADYIDLDGRPVEVTWDTCPPDNGRWPEPYPDETTTDYNARVDAFNARDIELRARCLRALGVDHFESRYHPDSMFSRFQLTESAICLLLSALLVGASLQLTRRLRP